MRITAHRSVLISMPLDPPIGLGAMDMTHSGCILTFLETDEGLVGEGLAFAINGMNLAPVLHLSRKLEPLLIGLDPNAAGRFTAQASGLRRTHPAPVAAMALAGVENALLDLRAKALDVNVAQLLGAGRTSMPVYQSGELWVSLSTDELARSASRQVKRGFRAVKMRLIGDPAQDVDRVRLVREAIGPDVKLMADANQKMDAPTTIRLGRLIEPYGLDWLEEPVRITSPKDEKRVAQAIRIPLALGESVHFAEGARDLLNGGAVGIIMPDLQRMGGPKEFLKASVLAELAGVPFSSHLFPEMSLALLAAIPGARILEYMSWVSGIYREELELDAQGEAVVPDRPGWGFSFDPQAVKRYTV